MWHILEHIALALSLALNAFLFASLAIAYDLPRILNEPIFREAKDLKDMHQIWNAPTIVEQAMREKFHVHGITSNNAPVPDVRQPPNRGRSVGIRKSLRIVHAHLSKLRKPRLFT